MACSASTRPTWTDPYGYLGQVGAFTFNFPTLWSNVDATEDGENVGITDTNLDVCCWHDEYIDFPDFLQVLAFNVITGNACAIGNFFTAIVQNIEVLPVEEDAIVGQQHGVTAGLADSQGNYLPGRLIDFEVIAGPHTGVSGQRVSNFDGMANWGYVGTTTGTDTIQACFTDDNGDRQCDTVTKTWISAECFLVLGSSFGGETFDGSIHTWNTYLNGISSSYPVTIENNPDLPLPIRLPKKRRQFNPVKIMELTAQVLMWNPDVFPTNPEQYSSGLRVSVWLDGSVTSASFGSKNGITIRVEMYTTPTGQSYLKFPFDIAGI